MQPGDKYAEVVDLATVSVSKDMKECLDLLNTLDNLTNEASDVVREIMSKTREVICHLSLADKHIVEQLNLNWIYSIGSIGNCKKVFKNNLAELQSCDG